ncbi:lecithin retinol acyltransferase family protein [Helicobacter felis]|uniref:lecithin retinol acyltransferase family protein n=1 Tax=Helicobacter felis TaxID=214 RepID=UPI001F2C362A|nr:lecithin retinol acyltransferase family protein [Helicobacter felis]
MSFLKSMTKLAGLAIMPGVMLPALMLPHVLKSLSEDFYEAFLEKYPTRRKGDLLDSDPVDGDPAIGSILWCDLGDFAHSGVYIGGRQIMHLTGKFNGSHITSCGVDGFSNGKPIFVSCRGKMAVGDPNAARYAEAHEDEDRDYNVFKNNCHGFTAECFTGNTQDEVRIKKPSDIGELLGMDCWRWWKYQ